MRTVLAYQPKERLLQVPHVAQIKLGQRRALLQRRCNAVVVDGVDGLAVGNVGLDGLGPDQHQRLGGRGGVAHEGGVVELVAKGGDVNDGPDTGVRHDLVEELAGLGQGCTLVDWNLKK